MSEAHSPINFVDVISCRVMVNIVAVGTLMAIQLKPAMMAGLWLMDIMAKFVLTFTKGF